MSCLEPGCSAMKPLGGLENFGGELGVGVGVGVGEGAGLGAGCESSITCIA